MLHYILKVSIFFIQTKLIAKIKKKKREQKMTTFMHAVAVKETHQTYEPPLHHMEEHVVYSARVLVIL